MLPRRRTPRAAAQSGPFGSAEDVQRSVQPHPLRVGLPARAERAVTADVLVDNSDTAAVPVAPFVSLAARARRLFQLSIRRATCKKVLGELSRVEPVDIPRLVEDPPECPLIDVDHLHEHVRGAVWRYLDGGCSLDTLRAALLPVSLGERAPALVHRVEWVIDETLVGHFTPDQMDAALAACTARACAGSRPLPSQASR